MNTSILKLSEGDKVQFPTAEEPTYILDYPFEPLDARGLTGIVTCLEETDTNFFLINSASTGTVVNKKIWAPPLLERNVIKGSLNFLI